MERWVGKVAIVSGASSGIGEAIADRLTKAGMLVVGLARRYDRIQINAEILAKSGATGKLYALQCNMREEDDIVKAIEWTTNHVGNVHVLINNAAVIGRSNISEGDTEVWRRVLETNVLSHCIATKEAIKVMKENKIEGHIVNINSICGHQVMCAPNLGLYGASKYAMTSFTDILRHEMVEQKTNIKVTSISPGVVNTEMITTKSVTEEISKMFNSMPMLQTEDIAEMVVYALSVPKHVQINELIARSVNSTI